MPYSVTTCGEAFHINTYNEIAKDPQLCALGWGLLFKEIHMKQGGVCILLPTFVMGQHRTCLKS